ncbi:DUF1876 domain-containing protein [Streptomyces sp. 7-21]|jgi:hypothetical protein|uniref:DUF1876 domain-containing protein n=1 Tax=Streptomyces sp. 7-21 TaxID=2802283 RepID=UPI001920104C|nr:DUF1876 domain-containing protein [Streptomyces sp. 7-21]MBL1066604.1 DUF1876 domain-containing protein [Streptomyces sp. 7-21]
MAQTWNVRIAIDVFDRTTRAEARLEDRPDSVLVGEGSARANPTDENVPDIGRELAAARALSDLSHQLIHETVQDIESHTHQRVTRLKV